MPAPLPSGATEQTAILPEQTREGHLQLGDEIAETCIVVVFIFVTASALPQRLHTAAGGHYPGIMLYPADVIRLQWKRMGISASPSWLGG